LSLIAAGLVNLVAGFMGLFPGMFEASATSAGTSDAGSIDLVTLVGTPYGRYALAHLAGAGLQLGGGSWIRLLAEPPFTHSLAVLCFLSLSLEAWGWALKGSLTALSGPGLAAAVLTAMVYGRALRARAAA
jgi:hypothetical protein